MRSGERLGLLCHSAVKRQEETSAGKVSWLLSCGSSAGLDGSKLHAIEAEWAKCSSIGNHGGRCLGQSAGCVEQPVLFQVLC